MHRRLQKAARNPRTGLVHCLFPGCAFIGNNIPTVHNHWDRRHTPTTEEDISIVVGAPKPQGSASTSLHVEAAASRKIGEVPASESSPSISAAEFEGHAVPCGLWANSPDAPVLPCADEGDISSDDSSSSNSGGDAGSSHTMGIYSRQSRAKAPRPQTKAFYSANFHTPVSPHSTMPLDHWGATEGDATAIGLDEQGL
ncbi:hypothetical protein HaLaN_11926 [Haematococcus lacustris]|uniref:Uncharacterized protein n=1 Tax=Haematococcus lacustris TaxID=44745 RepID=A0A699Z971_HAELA|nr:hypothetical protein HaLaN_11926 [Haematococcus lacustris]